MPRGSPTHIYQAIRIEKRPREDTPLSFWLKHHGVSHFQLAERLRCDPKMVRYWAAGRSIPGLIYAFKIEKETAGAVPVASWLGTELGRALWNHEKAEWAGKEHKRRNLARQARKKEEANGPAPVTE